MVTVQIQGIIGESTTLKSVKAQFDLIPEDQEEVPIDIYSVGGGVFEGRAIANFIKNYPKKTIAKITSYCGSIATSIALSCNEVEIEPDARFMIHYASVDTDGNKDELKKAVQELDQMDQELISTYKSKTKLPTENIDQWMKEEKSFTGIEAVKYGFADRLMKPIKALSKLDNYKMENESEKKLNAFEKMLDGFLVKFKNLVPGTTDEPKNMEVTLADGQVLFVESEDGEFVNKPVFLVSETGERTPAPDGVHDLQDGRKITVANGVITAVEEQANPVDAMKKEIEDLKNQIAQKDEALAQANQKMVNELTTELTNIKNQFKNLKLGEYKNEKPTEREGEKEPHPLDNFAKQIKRR